MSLEPLPVSPPSISVVIAVRNGAATLQRALDSVFEQTHLAVELIVMDAASTDGTVEILERNASRIGYWESEPDRGIYHAWNKALDHATGDWICFLGADDRYHAPTALAAVAAALAVDDGGHEIAYGALEKLFPDGRVYHARGSVWGPGRRRRFRRGEMIPHPSTFHHRALFERLGRFDESFRIAGDYEFLLRVLLDQDPLYIPEILVDMAAGGLSDRPSNRSLVAREVYRARYLHGVAKTPPWRSLPLIRTLTRIWFRNTFGDAWAGVAGSAARTTPRKPGPPPHA